LKTSESNPKSVTVCCSRWTSRARRIDFFVSRETLGDVERSRLTDNHDMLASFDRQHEKIKHAVSNTLRLGTSHNITFLKTDFFH
jgi:23S rRNA G2445 N2-methylase RlmL